MEKIAYLIEKFWQGKASREEKEQLYELLQNHSEEWKSYMHTRFTDDAASLYAPLEEALSMSLLEEMHRKIGVEKAPVLRIKVWRWVAAAVIISIISTIAVFQLSKPVNNYPVAITKEVNDAVERIFTVIENKDKKEMLISLADGSVIRLYQHSSVQYHEPFDSTDRNIILEGNAYFKVAKNRQHPFAVTSRGYTTTALGTAFEISTHQQDLVNIKLFEGKVVIESVDDSKYPIEDTYLNAGQQLTIHTALHQYSLTNIPSPGKAISTTKAVDSIPDNIIVHNMNYHKTSLKDIFRSLAQMNNITIQFNEEDIQGLTFTGSFSAEDDYQTVLSIICGINDLALTEEKDGVLLIQKLP